MKHFLVSSLASAFSLLPVSSCFAAEITATEALGASRLLVVCLPGFEDRSIAGLSQRYQNIDWDGYANRDLRLIGVSPKTRLTVQLGSRHHHDQTRTLSATGSIDVVFPMLGTDIIDRANCKVDYEFILIGKDTGVKARWIDDFSQTDLFNRIDAMPMRQFEMRTRGAN
jgi:hypothetical protein